MHESTEKVIDEVKFSFKDELRVFYVRTKLWLSWENECKENDI